MKLDPNNQGFKDSLEQAKSSLNKPKDNYSDYQQNPLANLFNNPANMQKLANNPGTKHLLTDPNFMNKMNMVRQNPNLLTSMMQDPQMMQAFSVMLGLGDMNMNQPPPKKTDTDENMEEDIVFGKKETPEEKQKVEESNSKKKAKELKDKGTKE